MLAVGTKVAPIVGPHRGRIGEVTAVHHPSYVVGFTVDKQAVRVAYDIDELAVQAALPGVEYVTAAPNPTAGNAQAGKPYSMVELADTLDIARVQAQIDLMAKHLAEQDRETANLITLVEDLAAEVMGLALQTLGKTQRADIVGNLALVQRQLSSLHQRVLNAPGTRFKGSPGDETAAQVPQGVDAE
jgi:hypothetical protein